MTYKAAFMGALLSCALIGCTASDAPRPSADEITEIALSDVPADVRSVVMSASPDFEMEEVVKKVRDGRTYFDVEGELPNGDEIEFDVLMTDSGPEIVEIQRDLLLTAVPKPVRDVLDEGNSDDLKVVRVIESRQAGGDIIIYEFFVDGHPSDPRFEVSVSGDNPPQAPKDAVETLTVDSACRFTADLSI